MEPCEVIECRTVRGRDSAVSIPRGSDSVFHPECNPANKDSDKGDRVPQALRPSRLQHDLHRPSSERAAPVPLSSPVGMVVNIVSSPSASCPEQPGRRYDLAGGQAL
eukprot:4033479-Pyramimonas_sp.AAC.1